MTFTDTKSPKFDTKTRGLFRKIRFFTRGTHQTPSEREDPLAITSDGVAVGAAGNGTGEHGDGGGRLRRRHCGRQADADGVGGTAVHAQDNAVLTRDGRRGVAVLVAAHLAPGPFLASRAAR